MILGNNRSRILQEPRRTHDFVWEALQWWSSSGPGTDTVPRMIRPGGIPLSDWLRQFPAGSRSLADSWMRRMGLRLARLGADQKARNMASYRPTGFITPGPRPIADTMNTVANFWDICDPESNGGFPVLDRHLLRHSLELSFKNQHGQPPKRARRKYRSQVQAMLGALNPRGLSPDQWVSFLNYKVEKETHPILLNADGTKPLFDLDHSKQVLARATLLLRLATGCSAALIEAAGDNAGDDLSFWWSDLSVRRHLWAEANIPDSFAELWSDIEEASESVKQWSKNGEPPPTTPFGKGKGQKLRCWLPPSESFFGVSVYDIHKVQTSSTTHRPLRRGHCAPDPHRSSTRNNGGLASPHRSSPVPRYPCWTENRARLPGPPP